MDTSAPRAKKPARPVLESPVVRLAVSVVAGMLLILITVEASRLIAYYRESDWLARLAETYTAQASDAERKANTLRQRANATPRSTYAAPLLQEAEQLERQAENLRKKAAETRREGERRSFRWWPEGARSALTLPVGLSQ